MASQVRKTEVVALLQSEKPNKSRVGFGIRSKGIDIKNTEQVLPP